MWIKLQNDYFPIEWCYATKRKNSPLKSYQEVCWWTCQTFGSFISTATTALAVIESSSLLQKLYFAPSALSVWEFCHFEGNICHGFQERHHSCLPGGLDISVSSSLSKHTAPCHVTLCYIMWPVNKCFRCSFSEICLHRGRLVTPERNLLRYIWVGFFSSPSDFNLCNFKVNTKSNFSLLSVHNKLCLRGRSGSKTPFAERALQFMSSDVTFYSRWLDRVVVIKVIILADAADNLLAVKNTFTHSRGALPIGKQLR